MSHREIISYISAWIKSYASNAGVKGLTIGISGGIDSAVTSVLCAETGLPTLCLELPIHQAQSHVDRAQEHISWLTDRYSNVLSASVDLTQVFDTFATVVPSASQQIHSLALANARSRLRMTTLYYFAGLYGYLVVGTGNKVEDFGVGFYTKYGDGGVDISPIADLMKSEVYALGAEMGIINSIMKAAPSDGLFEDTRSDEQQLGASYDELEWAMLMFEKGKESSDFQGRKREVMEIYQRLNKINQHKMIPIPVCKIPRN